MNLSNINWSTMLPLFTGIMAASLGYLFGMRTKKLDRFFQYSETSMKEVYIPLFHKMKQIHNPLLEQSKKEELIQTMFTEFLSNNSNIFKLSNKKTLKQFYQLEEMYNNHKFHAGTNSWDDFWGAFNNFFQTIETEFWSVYDSVYYENKWIQYNLNKSIWVKFYNESVRFLYQTSKFLIVVTLLLNYFAIVDTFNNSQYFGRDFLTITVLSFLGSIVIFGCMKMLYVHLSDLFYKDEKMKGILRKLFHLFRLKKAIKHSEKRRKTYEEIL